MTFPGEQIRTAYQNLHPEVIDLVMANETTELIKNLFNKFGMSRNTLNAIDSELLYAMLGLQTLETALNNITSISGKPASDFSGIKSILQKEIFRKIDDLKAKEGGKNRSAQETTPPITPEARSETHPAIVPGEVAHGVPRVAEAQNPTQRPSISYPPGKDPYREPIE